MIILRHKLRTEFIASDLNFRLDAMINRSKIFEDLFIFLQGLQSRCTMLSGAARYAVEAAAELRHVQNFSQTKTRKRGRKVCSQRHTTLKSCTKRGIGRERVKARCFSHRNFTPIENNSSTQLHNGTKQRSQESLTPRYFLFKHSRV